MISKCPADTEKFARKIFFRIKPNKSGATVFGLFGDLGAGKTAFVRFLSKHAGIKKKINSPTFVIMKRYPIKHEYFDNLFHLDAYRLKNEQELVSLGWKDIVADPRNLIFVEWPENIIKAMPKKYHRIFIEHGNGSGIREQKQRRKIFYKK